MTKLISFIKNKKGGSELLAIILIPALLIIIFTFSMKINNETVLKKRLQTALDSALIYASQQGKKIEIKDESGEIHSVCSFEEEYILNTIRDVVYNGIIKEVDGYNETWELTIEVSTKDDNSGNQIITMTVKGYAPSDNITDYEKWYQDNLWDASFTNTIEISATGSTTCR